MSGTEIRKRGKKMDNNEIKEAVTEAIKIRNKIQNVDEKSEPLKKYCKVSMILMGVVAIAGLCIQSWGVAILAGLLIPIFALMLWANNREHKKVRIDVGRGLPVMMGMIQVMIIVALIGSIYLKIKM